MNKEEIFKRDNGSIEFDPSILPFFGVIFLIATWSESRLYLMHLLKIMNEYLNIPLYIYDIDGESYLKHQEKLGILSQGKGEVLFLREGKVKIIITDYKKEKDIKKLIEILE